MTITEFLLAQIAADEELLDWGNPVRIVVDPHGPGDASFPFHDRWKAECEAKRRIVADHAPIQLGDGWWCSRCDQTETPGKYDDRRNYLPSPCPTLLALALVYADRQDFAPAWRQS